ncbi:MAG TPA: 6,7-dimethyl-8-ribityllumazine synthase [Spirochaetota bacterium]|nr:6,7-dimethyl-8-ribityllumazine synthase [Spirochaetota bacterium]HOM38220.1 6,7-dimethyl-8-ribityllumazine synthase [Spirochaetota bacterium]HPQ48562.1 6,7-dimethyl-8-ribityllumazine synthase [Spirochaetota bacterium]
MPKRIEGKLKGEDLKIGIIASRFNSFIVERLIEGAVDSLLRHGVEEKNIEIIMTPGAFEIPSVLNKVIRKSKYDGIICLGAVIRGATPHFDYVAAEVSKGIATISMKSDIPITFGVLTTDNIEQAIERAGTKAGNKGFEAALSLLEMINLYRELDNV